MVDGNTLVVVMLSNAPYTRAYDVDLLEELRRDGRAGGILALSGRADGRLPGEHLLFAGMDGASDVELSLLHVIVAQCYAFAESLARGLTPDRAEYRGRRQSCRAGRHDLSVAGAGRGCSSALTAAAPRLPTQ